MAVATSPKVPTGGADIDVDAGDSAESRLLNFESAILNCLLACLPVQPRGTADTYLPTAVHADFAHLFWAPFLSRPALKAPTDGAEMDLAIF
jgi:hypothetical protein